MAQGVVDLVLNMLVNDHLLAERLGRSERLIRTYRERCEAVSATLTKWASAAGIAVGGVELFDTAMHSCGETQRKFENITLGAMKSVQNFFEALTTGDWSIYEGGIMNAIKLGEDYIDTLRRLKQNLNIGDVHMSEVEKTMDDWVKFFENPDISPEIKMQKYTTEYMEWASHNLSYSKKLSGVSEKNFIKILKDENVSTSGLSTQALRNIVFDFNDEAGINHWALEKYAKARKIQETRQNLYNRNGNRYSKGLQESNREVAQLEKNFKGIKTAYDIKVKLEGTKKMDELLDTTDKLIGIEDRGLKVGYDADNINRMFMNDFKTTPKPTPKVAPKPTPKVPPKLSIDDVIQQFDVMNKKVKDGTITLNNNATESVNAWNKVKEAVVELKKEYSDYQLLLKKKNKTAKEKEELKNKEQNILSGSKGITENLMKVVMLKEQEIAPIAKIKFDKDKSLKELEFERKQIVERLNNSQTPSDYVKIKAELEAKDAQIAEFKNGGDTLTAKPFQMVEEDNSTLNKKYVKDTHTKHLKGTLKTAKTFNNLARAIRGVGGAMAATGNQSKAMARSLAMVNAAASIGMMISIMVEKSKASLTIWDWIAGITAGVATVTAMAAQLRAINTAKYADGGIVGGNSTIGDMNLARVNSGEMILNNRQQRNLFNLLNGSGIGTSNGGSVEFKIRGRELVGVLDNYNNKMGKLR